jgi:hypothetical protein
MSLLNTKAPPLRQVTAITAVADNLHMRATTQHNPNPARWQSSVRLFHVGFKSQGDRLQQSHIIGGDGCSCRWAPEISTRIHSHSLASKPDEANLKPPDA